MGRISYNLSVDIEKLSKLTSGFSGADLQNLVNVAALKAASDGKNLKKIQLPSFWNSANFFFSDKTSVGMAEFDYALDKHKLGTDWKSRVRTQEDLELTAYHEAGHTLVAYFSEKANPIYKVS